MNNVIFCGFPNDVIAKGLPYIFTPAKILSRLDAANDILPIEPQPRMKLKVVK